MTIPCLPPQLLQMRPVESHKDHIKRTYPTTPFAGCSRELKATVHFLLQRAVCFTNPSHEQEEPRNWHVTGMLMSSWRGRVLTGLINPENLAIWALCLPSPPLHSFLPTLRLLTSLAYFLRYSPVQQLPQNLTRTKSEFLHPSVKCSLSPRDFSPKIWGTIAIFITNRLFHLVLWALFIFPQSIV